MLLGKGQVVSRFGDTAKLSGLPSPRFPISRREVALPFVSTFTDQSHLRERDHCCAVNRSSPLPGCHTGLLQIAFSELRESQLLRSRRPATSRL